MWDIGPRDPSKRVIQRVEDFTRYGTLSDAEGLARIEARLQENPDDLNLMDWVAFMFYSHGVPHKALQYYQRLLDKRPGNASYHYFLGNLWARQGDSERAHHHWSKVIELDLEGDYADKARGRLGLLGEDGEKK